MLLAEVLCKIGETERSSEMRKQDLISGSSFNPYVAFDMLDTNGLNEISCEDINSFLGKFKIRDDPKLLVLDYDSNDDGVLSFADFLNIVLPADSDRIRQQALTRTGGMDYYSQVTFARFWTLRLWLWTALKNISFGFPKIPQD